MVNDSGSADSVDAIGSGKTVTSSRLVVIIILVVAIVAGAIIYSVIHPASYVSTLDGFQIRFPANPSVYNLASKKDPSGGTESGRLYGYANQAAATDYAVYVINYSGNKTNAQTNLEKKALLQADVDQLASAESASVVNGKFISFNGYNAVSASLVPTTKADASAYLLAFLKGNRLYMILGAGLSQSKFNTFAYSFKLTS